MIQFNAVIKKFGNQGEKTGWSYIEVSVEIAQKLKPGYKKSFRVNGSFDKYKFTSMAMIPMGQGIFIIAIKLSIRKIIQKFTGASVLVSLELDNSEIRFNDDLMQCMQDEPECFSFFNSLSSGHKKYFSNWIDNAKTEATKTKRIAQTLNALSNHQNYGEMARALNNKNKSL